MATAEPSRSLEPRHLAMISIGGIIGAGLFVGSQRLHRRHSLFRRGRRRSPGTASASPD